MSSQNLGDTPFVEYSQELLDTQKRVSELSYLFSLWSKIRKQNSSSKEVFELYLNTLEVPNQRPNARLCAISQRIPVWFG